MIDAIGHIFLAVMAMGAFFIGTIMESTGGGRVVHATIWIVGAVMAIAASGVLTP